MELWASVKNYQVLDVTPGIYIKFSSETSTPLQKMDRYTIAVYYAPVVKGRVYFRYLWES